MQRAKLCLGLEPQHSRKTLSPPAQVWWQEPSPVPAGPGTQGDKSSVLLGQSRELALKPRGLLSLQGLTAEVKEDDSGDGSQV